MIDWVTRFLHSLRNPTPGKIINRPDGDDVYHGVLKDYTGLKVESTLYRNFGPCVFNSFIWLCCNKTFWICVACVSASKLKTLFTWEWKGQSPLVKLTKIDLGSPPPTKKIILGTLHLDSNVEGLIIIVINSDCHH